MGLMDLQNLVGRTFETQAVYQQVVSQADQALRQKERRLAEDRADREALVEQGASADAQQPLDLDLSRREAHQREERARRYRLSLLKGGARGAEASQSENLRLGSRVDLKI